MGRKKKSLEDGSIPLPDGVGVNPFAFKAQREEEEMFSGFSPPKEEGPPDVVAELLKSPYEVGSYEHKVFTLAYETNASLSEMALILGLPEETLKSEFEEATERGWTACKIRLRRAQLAAGVMGDSKMMSHLGKNILKQDQEEETKGNVTIVISTGVPRKLEDVPAVVVKKELE